MSKYEAGQTVKCVWSDDRDFTVGKEYKIVEVGDEYIYLETKTSKFCPVLMKDSLIARFEPISPKFIAVSGDQSLFDLVGANDNDLYVFTIPVMRGIRASSTKAGVENRILAERRPYVEKWIPRVGELFVYQGKVYQCTSAEYGPGCNTDHVRGIDLLTGGKISLQYITDDVISKPKGI